MSLFEWLDASGLREAVLTSTLLVVVALLAASVFVVPKAGPLRFLEARWLFVLVAVLAIFASRWPSISYHLELTRDEAQMTAQAITIPRFPIPWKSYDGTISGPLNSAALIVPALFDEPVTFATARVTGIALFIGTLAFLFVMTRTLYGELAARVGILLPLSFFCCARSPDFTHYSIELLPMFLLSAGAYGLVRFATIDTQSWNLALAGLALGCLLFANLQGAILGLVLFIAGVGLITWRDLTAPDRARRLLWLFAGTCCVPAIILTFVVISGAFHDFFVSYVELPVVYMRANCCTVAGAGFFFSDPFFRAVLESSMFLLVVSVAGIALLGRKESRRPLMWLPALIAVLLVPVSIYSIEVSQTPFEHYLFLVLWPLCAASSFAFGALLTEMNSDQRLQQARIWILLQGVLVACGPSIALNLTQPNPYLGRLAQNLAHAPDPPTAMLLRHVKAGERMAVWGWMPRYFVETQALLGTRDAVTQFQIDPRVFQTYYRRRYLADMRANRPKFFVDAVAPGSYRYKDRATEGHESFPALGSYVRADYTLIDEAKGVRLYQRKG